MFFPSSTKIARCNLYHIKIFPFKNENTELLCTVQTVQKSFLALLESSVGGTHELSPGKMLLMGFNGLFTRLDDEFHTVLECMDAMTVPDMWKKVDVIREAKSLQVDNHSHVDTFNM